MIFVEVEKNSKNNSKIISEALSENYTSTCITTNSITKEQIWNSKIKSEYNKISSSTSLQLLPRKRKYNETSNKEIFDCNKNDTEKNSKNYYKKIKMYMKSTSYNLMMKTNIKKNYKNFIIIDGNDIAYEHSKLHNIFSVEGLEICLKYFEKLDYYNNIKAIVPQHCFQYGKSTNRWKLRQLHINGKIILSPSKNLPTKCCSSCDDIFIMYLAIAYNGLIITNDNYENLFKNYPELRKFIRKRLIRYQWNNNKFLINEENLKKSLNKFSN